MKDGAREIENRSQVRLMPGFQTRRGAINDISFGGCQTQVIRKSGAGFGNDLAERGGCRHPSESVDQARRIVALNQAIDRGQGATLHAYAPTIGGRSGRHHARFGMFPRTG